MPILVALGSNKTSKLGQPGLQHGQQQGSRSKRQDDVVEHVALAAKHSAAVIFVHTFDVQQPCLILRWRRLPCKLHCCMLV